MRRIAIFGEVGIQLHRVLGDHVQLVRQSVQLSDNALKFLGNFGVFLLELSMLILPMLVRMSQRFNLSLYQFQP